MNCKAIALAAVASVALVGGAEARDQIQIVGSSTVFPFSTAVAEQFGKSGSFKAPVVESTGTGGGMKLFCKGVGVENPDMTNASRRIKADELAECKANGVTPVEVKVGFDGIVVANAKSGPKFSLTREQLYLALAAQIPSTADPTKLVKNYYEKWTDLNPELPNQKIEVLGPPPTSGTRDAFSELVMEEGAKKQKFLGDLRKAKEGDAAYEAAKKQLGDALFVKDGKALAGDKVFVKLAHGVREDGVYIEAGENDNLIVQKLDANPVALGIFGFSFLDQNADKIKGASIEGVQPTFDAIASGEYKVSRSLYFYVKKEHVGVVPGIAEYVAEFTSEAAWGPDGYLAAKGLIPLPEADRAAVATSAKAMTPLSL